MGIVPHTFLRLRALVVWGPQGTLLVTPRDTHGDPKRPSHGKSVISLPFWTGVGSLESCRPPGCVSGVWWFGDTKGPPWGPPHGKSVISQPFWTGVGSLES